MGWLGSRSSSPASDAERSYPDGEVAEARAAVRAASEGRGGPKTAFAVTPWWSIDMRRTPGAGAVWSRPRRRDLLESLPRPAPRVILRVCARLTGSCFEIGLALPALSGWSVPSPLPSPLPLPTCSLASRPDRWQSGRHGSSCALPWVTTESDPPYPSEAGVVVDPDVSRASESRG